MWSAGEREERAREDAVSRVAGHTDDRECTPVSWSTNYNLRCRPTEPLLRCLKCPMTFVCLRNSFFVISLHSFNFKFIQWIPHQERHTDNTSLFKRVLKLKTLSFQPIYINKINSHGINQLLITYSFGHNNVQMMLQIQAVLEVSIFCYLLAGLSGFLINPNFLNPIIPPPLITP